MSKVIKIIDFMQAREERFKRVCEVVPSRQHIQALADVHFKLMQLTCHHNEVENYRLEAFISGIIPWHQQEAM